MHEKDPLKFDHGVNILQCIHSGLKEFLQTTAQHNEIKQPSDLLVHIPFRGTELYLLHKAFIDAGGASSEIYKSLLEKTASNLGNKNQQDSV